MPKFASAPTSISKTRKLLSAVAAIAVGGLLAIGLTQPAFATVTPATFNVTLQTSDARIVEGARVDVYHFVAGDNQWEYLDRAYTNALGQFDIAIPGLVAGDKYAAYFDASSSSPVPVTDANGWLTQNSQSMVADFNGSTTYFVATTGANTKAETLSPGISLTGNIYAPDGTTPSTDANEADLWRYATSPAGTQSWQRYTYVPINTGADSSYAFANLSPGSYEVEISQDTQPTWAHRAFNLGHAYFAVADAVTVVAGTPATQDVNFTGGGTISGTVGFAPAQSSPDSPAMVLAYPVDSHNQPDQLTNDPVPANVDPTTGAYSLSVAPGKYFLEFQPFDNTYNAQWYDNRPYASGSTPIIVTDSGPDNAITNVNQTLGQGITVEGTVTTAAGPLSGIDVALLPTDGSTELDTTTDVTGHYTFTAPPGSYNVKFSDASGSFPDRYLSDTAGGASNQGLATTITAAEGDYTEDFVYDDYSSLTVHLANKAGAPISGAFIEATAMSDGSVTPNSDFLEGTPVVGHLGSYRLSGLQLGKHYSLYFGVQGPGAVGTYSQFWGGGQDEGSSKLYTPTSSPGSLDVTLASSAAVTGIVSTTAGKGLKGIPVDLFAFDGTQWQLSGYVLSSSTGAYSFPNLATGSYTVQYYTAGIASPYIGTFAGGASDAASATHVYVAPGKPAVLSQHLALGGSLTGVVTGPVSTLKLTDIAVTPIALTGTPGAFTAATPSAASFGYSTTGGKFSLVGLPTGYYALSFSDSKGVYGDAYSSPVTDHSAHYYHVVAGTALAAGTIALPPLSSQATAHVTGSLDTTLAGRFDAAAGDVQITTPDGNLAADASIDTDGNFSADLVPGTYNWSSSIFDVNNQQNRFSDESGTFTVAAGPNTLSVPVIPAVALAITTDPAVDNVDPEVGNVYHLNNVTWNSQSSSVTAQYQWLRDGKPIYGATGTSYTSQGADLGAQLEVRVTVSDYYISPITFGGVSESVVKYATAADPVTESTALSNLDTPTTTADATGLGYPGQVIHATPGDWTISSGVNYDYTWIDSSDGTTVLGTGPTFTPTALEADNGVVVSLQVTASKLGYVTPPRAFDNFDFQVTQLAAPTVKVAPKVTAKVVGSKTVYTVTPGTWSVAGGTPVYGWLVNGDPVASNSTKTFIFDPAAVDPKAGVVAQVGIVVPGRHVGLTSIVARKSSGNVAASGASLSLQDSVVGTVNDFVTPVPVGSTLSMPAGVSFTFPDDNSPATTLTYQWKRLPLTTGSSVSIAGATKSTYVVSLADIGHHLLLEVTASSPTHLPYGDAFLGGTGALSNALVDNPVVVAHAATNTNNALTKISETVAAAWGTVTGVSDTYQWWECSGVSSTCTDVTHLTDFTPIVGAKTTSYTPSASEATSNDVIVLVVTGTKAGYTTGTAQSGPINIQHGAIGVSKNVAITGGLVGGIAHYGTKLTATTATFDVPGVTVSYKWQIHYYNGTSVFTTDGLGVQGGTTYTPVPGDFPYTGVYPLNIQVTETATKTGGVLAEGTTTSPVLHMVGLTNAVPTVKPVVTVAPADPITSSPVGWTVTPGTWPAATDTAPDPQYSISWYFNGHEAQSINGSGVGSPDTFRPAGGFTPEDSISVVVTRNGSWSALSGSYTVLVQRGLAPLLNDPLSVGTPVFGHTLSAPTDPYDAFAYIGNQEITAPLAYQWYSGTTAIAGATKSTFTPSTAYIGKLLKVRITSTSPDYATAVGYTIPVLFTAAPADHGSPTINPAGNVHPGGAASVDLSSYDVPGTTHGYQWQLSPDNSTWTNIAGATKPTYLVLATQLGKYLRVNVTTTKAGYTPDLINETPSQLIVAPAILTPTTAPSLAGTGAAGAVLTASPGVWNVVGTTFTYSWYRDGIVIPGVTGAIFTPTGDEVGEVISVDVVAHAAGYYAVTASPGSVSVIAGAAPTAITAPKITGVAHIGSTLTATSGIWSLDGLTFTYQWMSVSAGNPPQNIGTNQSTYQLTGPELGATVFVVVTATRAGFASFSKASLSTAVIS